MLRHAQGVVVCLALVARFRNLLDAPESDRKVVAIVPATANYQELQSAKNMLDGADALDRAIALLFKVKCGVQRKLLSRSSRTRAQHCEKLHDEKIRREAGD